MPGVALASRNPGKLREVRAILAGFEVAPPERGWMAPEETGATYLDNALEKARSHASFSGTATLADDSGIEVDALAGGPGPQSARFAGVSATDVENLAKLVQAVREVPEGRRTARYRCVAVLVAPGGEETVAEATVEGRLVLEPRGRGGFGYDPVFVPLGEIRTMAELEPGEKDAISHRGKAFRALVPALRRLGV